MVLLRLTDAAIATGVPEKTIYRWLAEGRLCRYGSSRPYRVDAYEVLALRDMLGRAVVA